MADPRLEGLRMAFQSAELLVQGQLEEGREAVRLRETFLRVAVVLTAAELALLGLLLNSTERSAPTYAGMLLGVILMLSGTIRFVLAPGGRASSRLVMGPNAHALAALATDPELTEEMFIRSRLRMLPKQIGQNAERLRVLVRWRMQGALLMTASIIATGVGLIFIRGGHILA